MFKVNISVICSLTTFFLTKFYNIYLLTAELLNFFMVVARHWKHVTSGWEKKQNLFPKPKSRQGFQCLNSSVKSSLFINNYTFYGDSAIIFIL